MIFLCFLEEFISELVVTIFAWPGLKTSWGSDAFRRGARKSDHSLPPVGVDTGTLL